MTGDVLHTDDVLLLTGTELESDDNWRIRSFPLHPDTGIDEVLLDLVMSLGWAGL
jgi:hypothetical protein